MREMRVIVSIRSRGLVPTIALIFGVLRSSLWPTTKERIRRRRVVIGKELHHHLAGTVVGGQFCGTLLPMDLVWGEGDLGSMLLGLYEPDVVAFLNKQTVGRRTLIDIGAGDGFYVLGAIRSGTFEEAIAFESSDAGRRSIRAGIALNDIDEKVTLMGSATPSEILAVIRSRNIDLKDLVVLIDIEGDEYSILNESLLSALLGAMVIVELHESTHEQSRRADLLLTRARSAGHMVNWIPLTGKNPYGIKQAIKLSDDDR